MDEHVLPECYADTILIGKLVPPRTRYNHKKGCPAVAREMKEGQLKDTFALGIIDKDKKVVKYLEEFEKIDELKEDLIMWTHKSRHHYIIQICPALEKWIIKVCIEGKISIKDFGLPDNFKDLGVVTKTITSLYDPRINRLCEEIAKRADIEKVRKLKAWVQYLKEKNFTADINELINV